MCGPTPRTCLSLSSPLAACSACCRSVTRPCEAAKTAERVKKLFATVTSLMLNAPASPPTTQPQFTLANRGVENPTTNGINPSTLKLLGRTTWLCCRPTLAIHAPQEPAWLPCGIALLRPVPGSHCIASTHAPLTAVLNSLGDDNSRHPISTKNVPRARTPQTFILTPLESAATARLPAQGNPRAPARRCHLRLPDASRLEPS